MDFGIEIVGDRLVDLRFERFPEQARAALRRRIDILTRQLLAGVRSAEPQRTGRLRGETQAAVDERADRIAGRVRVATGGAADAHAEAGKAAALEYGAHGSAQVSGYAMRLSHVYERQINPITVTVGAYGRRANIAQRRYLRGPLDALRGRFIEEMRQALAEAAGQS